MTRANATDQEQSNVPDPLITVLMPVYNGTKFLNEQVESILSQDGVSVRLQIIDDASTDGSAELLKGMTDNDPRIHVATNPRNLGLIPTIGLLLRTVRTDFFALADQDDIWDTSKLSRSVSALENSGASLIYSDVRLIDEHGEQTSNSYLKSRKIAVAEGHDVLPFIFRNPAIGHTLVGRAELAQVTADIPTFLRFHEPWIVAGACSQHGVNFLNETTGSYRVHSTNVIGPATTNSVLRLARGLSKKHLEARHQTRSRALRAVTHFRPDLQPLSDLMLSPPMARLRGTNRLLVALRSAPPIDQRHAFVEALLFALAAMRGIAGGERVAPSFESQQ